LVVVAGLWLLLGLLRGLNVCWLVSTGVAVVRVGHHLSELIVDVLRLLLLLLLSWLWLLYLRVLLPKILKVILAQDVTTRLKVEDLRLLLVYRLHQRLLKLTATLKASLDLVNNGELVWDVIQIEIDDLGRIGTLV